MRLTIEERLDRKTDKSGGPDACWLWTGKLTHKGIPMVWDGTRGEPARRVVWQLIHGPIPKGRAATITCGTRGCVHPAHLELVLFKSDLAERFWSHVDQSAGPEACWPWKDAASFRNGYGMFRIGWKKPIRQASRIAYELANNVPELKTENVIMHSCDNPPCCNPAHLTLGTHQTNHDDMMAKGRHSHGAKHAEACARGRRTARSA